MTVTIDSGRVKERVALHTVVPLAAPFTVGIAPSDLCNFKCCYCNQATDYGIKGGRILPWNDFVEIMAQIESLYKDRGQCKLIRLIGNGEPLLNKKLPDMIKYIADKNITERIEVTTNASLLTPDMSRALVDAGLTRLLISIQGLTSEKYLEICKYRIDFDELTRNITYFYDNRKSCKLHIKTLNISLVDGEEDAFYRIFGRICDTINIENVIDACRDVDYGSFVPQDSKNLTRYGFASVAKKCCDVMFYLLNIHSHGYVDACGCKYPPLFIGNVFKKPLTEIWNKGKHKGVMAAHLKGLRDRIPFCRDCMSIIQYNVPEDNLDEHLAEVLERVKSL
jgi:MoaA/NifB/PqqE/SkfB family radical SAM enzyme